ncbi:MAG: hypothetical protein Q7S80_01500 [bacterium]|nr:hypothetical protein [bacterium]
MSWDPSFGADRPIRQEAREASAIVRELLVVPKGCGLSQSEWARLLASMHMMLHDESHGAILAARTALQQFGVKSA